MNWSALIRVKPPALAPLTRDAAKAHLRLDSDDEDDVVDDLIREAVAHVDGPNGIGIAMVAQEWRLSLDHFPAAIVLPLGPVLSISEIAYVDGAGDAQTLAADRYLVDVDRQPAVIVPAFGEGFPSARAQPGSVKIKFVAGFGEAAADVPDDLKSALKLIIGAFYADRETAEVPAGATAILNRYRAGLIV